MEKKLETTIMGFCRDIRVILGNIGVIFCRDRVSAAEGPIDRRRSANCHEWLWSYESAANSWSLGRDLKSPRLDVVDSTFSRTRPSQRPILSTKSC